jgi:hypothetical protein
MGLVLASSHVDISQWRLLPGLIVAGFGLGMTFAPLQTIAMRDVEPRMAGAASGVINTTRQLGAVIGSAAVGALLQHQLAVKLTAQARANADELPPQFRDQFVNGFAHTGSRGLEVGAGQTGARVPAGLPEQARAAIEAVATKTFHEGFTDGMRATLWLPIAVLGLAALSCLLVRDTSGEPPGASGAPVAPRDAGVRQGSSS